MPKVFVIVVTHNASKWIDKCFGSLTKSTYPIRILVIDNKSTDGTPSLIQKKFPKVEIIENNKNIGFGKANNIGLKKVIKEDASFAFLLNQDAWVTKNTIETLVATANKFPDYGVLSPVHLNGDGSGFDHKFALYISENRTPGFISDCYLKTFKELYESEFVNAAAWLMRRDCIEKIGGFNSLFNQYHEDVEYVQRMNQACIKLGIVPSTVIYHDRNKGFGNKISFDSNTIRNNALLSIFNRKKGKPKRIFLIRRIIGNYLLNWVTYNRQNVSIIKQLQIDIMTLKLLKEVDYDNVEQYY